MYLIHISHPFPEFPRQLTSSRARCRERAKNFQIYRRLYQARIVNVFPLGIACDMSGNISFDPTSIRARSLRKSPIMSHCIGFLPRKGITMEGTINPFYPRTLLPLFLLSPSFLRPASSCCTITYGKHERAFRCVTLTVAGAPHELRWNLLPRCFFPFHPFALLSLSLSFHSRSRFSTECWKNVQKTKVMDKSGVGERAWKRVEDKRAEWR